MTTVSKKQKWFNTIQLTKDDDLYVGIDAHKESFHVAFWLNDAPALVRNDGIPRGKASIKSDVLGKKR